MKELDEIKDTLNKLKKNIEDIKSEIGTVRALLHKTKGREEMLLEEMNEKIDAIDKRTNKINETLFDEPEENEAQINNVRIIK